jgi:raffinose/stachyose/melibiose transport system permease protein
VSAPASTGNVTAASPAAAPPRKQRGGGPARHGKGGGLADWIGVGPPMLLFVLFIVVPMIMAVVLSFVSWNGVGSMTWAGGSNWVEFFHDPVAHNALWVTLKLVVLSYVVQTPISIGLGLFTAGKERYKSVYAAIFILPMLISTAGVSLMWESFLDPQFGPLNGHQNWLGDPNTALYAVTLIIAWQFIPFHTLLYAVGRRQIPAVLYEAARIDGANPVQMFFRVTLPQLRYTIVTSGILMVVGALTYFDIIYIMTDGGPGTSTRVLSLDMYLEAFQSDQFGYASVLAVVLGVIGIAIALIMVKSSGFSKMQSQQEGVA